MMQTFAYDISRKCYKNQGTCANPVCKAHFTTKDEYQKYCMACISKYGGGKNGKNNL